MDVVTYGKGGFDPLKPNGNVTSVSVVDAAPTAPEDLIGTQQDMVAKNLAASFTSTDQVAATSEQLHVAAKTGIANFTKDIADWPNLTDAQKLSHVLGLMQAMVGVLQHLTGDYT